MTVALSGAHAQPECVAPALSDRDIKDIVARERAAGRRLPTPFPEYRSTIHKQGCHYVYLEHAIPEAPDRSNVFTLNQHGVIVDAQPGHMDCPSRLFTDVELAAIVSKERARRGDLPPVLPNFTTRVSRLRCLYLYYENPIPFHPAKYQVFIIDPLGELLETFVSNP
jgi:hypothetical protein